MIANLIQRVSNAVSGTVAATALAASIFFAGCSSRDNPYEGMSLEQVVSTVNRPKEAQEYIDLNLSYAYGDLDIQRQTALNGAEVQGFRRTYDRKQGVCRDGSVAVAAMLKDDGFPALILDASWTGGRWTGHSVFVFQDSEGKWGSAGINDTDYRHTEFITIDDLARDVARQYQGDYKGFTLYNLSSIDLIEGTNEGLVLKTPFIKKQVMSGNEITGTTNRISTGYEHKWTDTSVPNSGFTKRYTDDLFEDYSLFTTSDAFGNVINQQEWQVLQRAPSRLPIETLQTLSENGEIITDRKWILYTPDNKVQQEILEGRNNGVLVCYAITLNEYNNGKKTAIETRRSMDGDCQFDSIGRTELNPDGTMTVYMDNNADGVWDSVTTSSQ